MNIWCCINEVSFILYNNQFLNMDAWLPIHSLCSKTCVLNVYLYLTGTLWYFSEQGLWVATGEYQYSHLTLQLTVSVAALLAFTQPVLVQREDPNSRQNTVKEIQRRAKAGGDWPQIIIFPEGTCTNRTCLISYKLGNILYFLDENIKSKCSLTLTYGKCQSCWPFSIWNRTPVISCIVAM